MITQLNVHFSLTNMEIVISEDQFKDAYQWIIYFPATLA